MEPESGVKDSAAAGRPFTSGRTVCVAPAVFTPGLKKTNGVCFEVTPLVREFTEESGFWVDLAGSLSRLGTPASGAACASGDLSVVAAPTAFPLGGPPGWKRTSGVLGVAAFVAASPVEDLSRK